LSDDSPRILVDSSAWIHFLRGTSPTIMEIVGRFIRENIAAVCGPVVTEVLRGARSQQEERLLRERFELLHFCALDREDFFEAATLALTLRRKGLTVKVIDLLIARVCLRDGLRVLHDDSDFEAIARHTNLKTLQP
jgi:hypothetical protein